jgi:hypothetical protein
VPFRYTGQREEAALGLYDYGARWYDPSIGRFIQADTIVPQPGNPQSLYRCFTVRRKKSKIHFDGSPIVKRSKGMTLNEKILRYTQTLPPSFREELLNYLQYLTMKAEQLEKQEWSLVSLTSAMRDLDEEEPVYSVADIKVVFA